MLSWVIGDLGAIKRFLKYQIVCGINKPYYRFYHVSRFRFQDPGDAGDAGTFQCVLCLSVAEVHRGSSPPGQKSTWAEVHQGGSQGQQSTGAAHKGSSQPGRPSGADRVHQLWLVFYWYMVQTGLMSTLRTK